ncbi:MAG: tRNA (cytidine(34)-2'-O)-methyltransferase [Hyphomicrobiales bacterium]|nr:MAG: tRNA (cytidine(34)-2'-O)-methyltransferase [Hyphomicrobiales bacterium]
MRHYTPRKFVNGLTEGPQIPLDLALYQPDIAQNTGSMLRLGACLGVAIHIIHPTGFPFSRKAVKRGGLDYLDHARFTEHDSYAHFTQWRLAEGRRLVLLTTRGAASAYESAYRDGDVLMVGRESAGVPDAVAEAADLRVRIPMRPEMRSLNVTMAASLVLGEALRQTGAFASLS